jgi:hypothetical protein
MKKVILKLLIVFTSFVYCKGQDTVFTQQEVLRIYEVVDSLESENDFLKRQSDLNFRLIKQYEISNKELEDLLSYNERYIAIRNAELETMEQSIVNLQKYIEATKRPFWDKPLVWVLVGASTIYASSLIVSNIR